MMLRSRNIGQTDHTNCSQFLVQGSQSKYTLDFNENYLKLFSLIRHVKID